MSKFRVMCYFSSHKKNIYAPKWWRSSVSIPRCQRHGDFTPFLLSTSIKGTVFPGRQWIPQVLSPMTSLSVMFVLCLGSNNTTHLYTYFLNIGAMISHISTSRSFFAFRLNRLVRIPWLCWICLRTSMPRAWITTASKIFCSIDHVDVRYTRNTVGRVQTVLMRRSSP